MSNLIVVGVDGSPASQLALSWAVAEAKLRNAPLRIVTAWEMPLLIAPVPIPEGYPSDLEQAVTHVLNRMLQELGHALDGVRLETKVVEGEPGRSLIGEARDAQLLVVGSRGLGGFGGLLLGSVSTKCIHHAPCPVVVVPQEVHHED